MAIGDRQWRRLLGIDAASEESTSMERHGHGGRLTAFGCRWDTMVDDSVEALQSRSSMGASNRQAGEMRWKL